MTTETLINGQHALCAIAPDGAARAAEDPTTSNKASDVTEYYGHEKSAGEVDHDVIDLDTERMRQIIYSFNQRHWDQAEALLREHLSDTTRKRSTIMKRRLHHLVGVCLSFKGEWLAATSWFRAAIRAPITDSSRIDVGDCAALRWLADTYLMPNRPTEAAIAYGLAALSPSSEHDPDHAILAIRTRTEKSYCEIGILEGAISSIDSKWVSPEMARMVLGVAIERSNAQCPSAIPLAINVSRRAALLAIASNEPASAQLLQQTVHKINSSAFDAGAPWPMLYDPAFAIRDVKRRRLLPYESDLLQVFTSNPEAQLPRLSPLGLCRSDIFTCSDLLWLIRTLRACLAMLEVQWSEVSNVKGSWFVARYSLMECDVATTHYFSLALFRQALISR